MDRKVRLDNWPKRLRIALKYFQDADFEWGRTDCCQMAAGCIFAMTGQNIVIDFDYASEHGAMLELRRKGYVSVTQWVERNFEEISPSEARRGDLGLVEDMDLLMAPAVIDGAYAFSKNQDGNVIMPVKSLSRAFAV